MFWLQLLVAAASTFVVGFAVGWTMAVGRHRRRRVGMIDLQRGRMR